jgi:hypothetical protein
VFLSKLSTTIYSSDGILYSRPSGIMCFLPKSSGTGANAIRLDKARQIVTVNKKEYRNLFHCLLKSKITQEPMMAIAAKSVNQPTIGPATGSVGAKQYNTNDKAKRTGNNSQYVIMNFFISWIFTKLGFIHK